MFIYIEVYLGVTYDCHVGVSRVGITYDCHVGVSRVGITYDCHVGVSRIGVMYDCHVGVSRVGVTCYHDVSVLRVVPSLFRFQDENTQAFFMVVSSSRWLVVRLDSTCSLFVTAVAIASLLIVESPGNTFKPNTHAQHPCTTH